MVRNGYYKTINILQPLVISVSKAIRKLGLQRPSSKAFWLPLGNFKLKSLIYPMKTKNETGRIATTKSTAEDTQRGNSASSSRRHLFHRSSVLGFYTTFLDIGFLSWEKDTRKESRSTPYIVVPHQASRRSSVSFFGAGREQNASNCMYH